MALTKKTYLVADKVDRPHQTSELVSLSGTC